MCALALAASVSSARGAVFRVPGDFTIIANAILAAAPGDTVRVAGNGGATYRERLIINKELTLEGGWRRDYQVRNPSLYVSVLRDDLTERSVVRVETTAPVTVDGFTIIGGRTGIEATNSNATIRNCEIKLQRNFLGSDPFFNRVGGGIRIAGGNVLIENTLVREVVSSFAGAGLAIVNAQSVTVRDSRFENLLAASGQIGIDTSGGGVFANGTGTLRMERCTVTRCGNANDGALLLANGLSFQAIDCTFSLGNASVSAGGVKLTNCPSIDLSACTIEDNQAIRIGGGLLVQNCPNFAMSDCIVRNNSCRDEGGGLRMLNTTFALAGNLFQGNHKDLFPPSIPSRGGSVGSLNCSGSVCECCFVNELASGWGGAWSQIGGNIDFFDCTFDNVECREFGGAHQIQLAGRALFERTLFHECKAKFGGAVAASFTGQIHLRRCTSTEGQAGTAGAALYLDTGARAQVESSILCCATRGNLVHCQGGVLEVSNTNTWNDDATNSRPEFSGCPSPVGTNGNIELNPQFCAIPGPPPFCDASLPAYTLQPNSPCVGSGAGGVDMGWKGVGCSSSPFLNLEKETWGRIKAQYRTR
ncbi:MAG TPA: right-handed parallel beta-helix repeat-containing protein [bacterium]|nr:right-handed parallel beta-helix repeat-containing protein [bacterium]